MGSCTGAAVDGTRCPFSECGKGYGLVSCAVGFARGAVGGLKGGRYVVTSDGDSPLSPAPGTLRYGTNLARTTPGGLWITFARSMTITLLDMLWVQSHTTLDGRGVNATIVGRNLVLGGVTNVIIHNLQLSNIRGSDTLHIFAGTTKVLHMLAFLPSP
jgi:pectate lyase